MFSVKGLAVGAAVVALAFPMSAVAMTKTVVHHAQVKIEKVITNPGGIKEYKHGSGSSTIKF